ncbi:HIT family protein [Clostridium folliculivorans]|uniref:HIT family protein n=1 Tax=Clostridium folliculivorans TaxID=2886038 RepID=A0A9W5Y0U2_9CLOT|nr:HIT family protein [Clostridium folliculivorans]GKU24382.1 HIT family protein [Clostridium folliculivorans]
MDCIFCKIVEGEIPCNLVYQDELIMCFLDIYPFNEGHVLIIPKTHYLDTDEIPNETLLAMMSLSKKIVKIIKEKYSPDGYSIMQNGGEFNDIGHYHMHVFPRYKGDGFGWTIPDTNHKVSQGISNELREMLNF